MTLLPSAKSLRAIFAEIKSIAVVGLSPKKNRPSHQVARYLMEAGYTIIPVNPGQERILDMHCYPDLLSIDRPVEVVDIFRRPEFVEPVVRDAITIGAKVIWMQQGIVNERAATIAEQAGLQVIMDRCMKVDHMQFAGGI